MVDQNDFRGQRIARAEFARRGVDISRADLYVMHGVMYMRGEVKPMPKSNIADMNAEMGIISKILRQRPEIRDIVLEVKTQNAEIIETEAAA
ncbi:MAG: hypothetical protein JST12_20355 [Armatimonadetes bacterium]|nr:hypothetical protein [Armatimonadota bacterium]MBS1704027.1 hypothetical protein [Armatimonadota bacterium]MBS1725630.1 hypothetical protein [Armatimonadota bacterium]